MFDKEQIWLFYDQKNSIYMILKTATNKIVCCAKSDIGLKRTHNEDAYLIEPDFGFFTVADGMGGAAAGEVASQIFTKTAFEIFSKSGRQSEQEILELVQQTFRCANEQILNQASNKPEYYGMGCTAELIAFYNNHFVLGHVGDSSTYLLRRGHLRKITRDHSLVQDQIDKGLLSKADAKNRLHRNVILRAVGVHEKLELDLIRGKGVCGDLFLLCSDGLTGMVDDPVIESVLSSRDTLFEKAEQLINLANSAGGNDNITVALCELTE